MPKPADNLSTLFRSLGPDDADFRAATLATAQEAEQRWPLFKSVSPTKPALTPALSEQENNAGKARKSRIKGHANPP